MLTRDRLQQTTISEYLASMERTQEALTRLNNDNIRSNKQAAMEMTNLLSYGNKTLDETFMQILHANTKSSIEPVNLMLKGCVGPLHYRRQVVES